MTIDYIIKSKHKGLLYNKLTLYQSQLQLRMDDGQRYDLAGDIINFPKRYTQIIRKLKSYEQTKTL